MILIHIQKERRGERKGGEERSKERIGEGREIKEVYMSEPK